MDKPTSLTRITCFILAITAVLIAINVLVDNQHMTEHKSHTGPADPASYEDWLMMKKEADVDLPKNFTLDMYKRFNMPSAQFRFNDTHLEGIEEVGPTSVAGRIRAFIVDQSNPARFLAAGISGGLWESMDRGESWSNLTPQEQHLNITSICQSPFDQNTFYFSTGEPTGNSAGISGIGIFKSTDGGYNFDLIPASMVSEFFRTWRIVHSPLDANTFFIASPDGFYVSRDGGEFFDLILAVECTDIEVLPSGEMYVATDAQGVFYSPDGSQNSFVARGNGLPNDYGRMELATSPNYNFMVASLENPEDGKLLDIYYSNDKATTWTVLPNPQSIGIGTSFAWYCQTLYLHPTDSNFILFGASGGAYTSNRGLNWIAILGVHADIHTATTDPANPDNIIVTSDGGIDRLTDVNGFKIATSLNNEINITQFYTGAVFPSGHILGGTQDNGTHFGENISNEFESVFGGDGSYCAVNPLDPSEIYVSSQRGNVYRIRDFFNNRNWDYIVDEIQDSYDNQHFIAPFQLNPDQPNQLFLTTRERLWWSENSGDNWEPLSSNFPSTPYRSAFIDRGTFTSLFIGGSNGLFFRFDNIEQHVEGRETNLRNSLPLTIRGSFIREIIAHPDGQSLFVVLSSFSEANRVWKVSDIFGADPTWESISGDLPSFLPVNTIAIDPENTDLLAIGTDYGLFTSSDGGEHWVLERDIPQTVIYQVILHTDSRLNIFTHGRGVFKATLSSLVSTSNASHPNDEITIFPNPVSNFISIKMNFPSHEITGGIFDMTGKIVLPIKANQNEFIAVSELPIGAYIIQLISGDQMTYGKFIKR